ncbi:hypothetical protein [Kineococcus terrestris]
MNSAAITYVAPCPRCGRDAAWTARTDTVKSWIDRIDCPAEELAA